MEKMVITLQGDTCTLLFHKRVYRGFCGAKGGSLNKQEGDGTTPLGMFPIHYGFYRENKPKTVLPMVKLTPMHHFVDDPLSPCYNRLVYGIPRHWAERLVSYPEEYAYGLVIEYNRHPVVKGKGSAIFLHCGEKPTAGCIALKTQDLLTILEDISSKNLMIDIKKG